MSKKSPSLLIMSLFVLVGIVDTASILYFNGYFFKEQKGDQRIEVLILKAMKTADASILLPGLEDKVWLELYEKKLFCDADETVKLLDDFFTDNPPRHVDLMSKDMIEGEDEIFIIVQYIAWQENIFRYCYSNRLQKIISIRIDEGSLVKINK